MTFIQNQVNRVIKEKKNFIINTNIEFPSSRETSVVALKLRNQQEWGRIIMSGQNVL